MVSKAVHRVLAVDDPSLQTVDLITETSDLILDETIPESANPTGTVTYNPTPISELNKIKNNINSTIKDDRKSRRHIPIQYSPQRPHNQTRQVGDSLSKSITYVPSSIQSLKDGEEANRNKYKPEYIPTNPTDTPTNISYLPTTISDETPNSTQSEYVPSSVQKPQDDSIESLQNNDIEVFLDEFLNDPNIYEPDINNEYVPTEKPKDSSRKSEKRTSDEKHDETSTKRHKPSKHSKDKEKSKSHTSKDKSKKESSKDRSSSSSRSSKSSTSTSKSSKSSSKDKKSEKSSKKSDKNSEKTTEKSSSSKHRKHSDSSKKESSKSSHKSSRSSEKKDKTHVSTLASGENSENLTLSTEEINMLNEDDLSDLDSDDPNSALEECKRIFDEYVPPKEEIKETKPVSTKKTIRFYNLKL